MSIEQASNAEVVLTPGAAVGLTSATIETPGGTESPHPISQADKGERRTELQQDIAERVGASTLELSEIAEPAGESSSARSAPTVAKREKPTYRQMKDASRAVPNIIRKYSSNDTVRRLATEEIQASTALRPSLKPDPEVVDKLLERVGVGLSTMRGIRNSLVSLSKGIEVIDDENSRVQVENTCCEVTVAFKLLFGYLKPSTLQRTDEHARTYNLSKKVARKEALGSLASSIGQYVVAESDRTFVEYAQKRLSSALHALKRRGTPTEYRDFEALIDSPWDNPLTTSRSSSPTHQTMTQAVPTKGHESPTDSETTYDTSTDPAFPPVSLTKRIHQALSENRPRHKPRRGRRSGHHGSRSTNM